MAKFTNKAHLTKASDEEIETFFAETTFEGIYSLKLKSKKSDFYKGSITDIRLEGRPTNILMPFLNVPNSSNSIPEGPCSFKCRMNIAAFRAEDSKYVVNLVGSSLRSITSLTESNVLVSAAESQEKELFDMWGVDNCQCIGFYHYDEESDVYIVDDLRKPNFDHIPYYPGDKERKPIRISYPHEIRGIKPNDYYLFAWKLSHRNKYNPYEIYLDFNIQPKPIDPKWFIDTLFLDRHNDKSKNFGSATNFLDTLSKQLSAKESTFVYELLQNANDYPVEGRSVDVEFHITDNYLLFLHTGEKFNVRNISGICGINEKEKVANKKTIGYKGIGFKTVFLNNHYVYLRTGDYSFRFDEGEAPEKKVGGKIKRLGAPFQILPIWTKHNEVAQEVNEIFDNSSKEFRVQIALRPDDKKILHLGRNCYENLFRGVFSDSNIILFIPNINSVRVFINGQEERACFRNNEEWIVRDYENEIKTELRLLINKTIDKGNSRIPEKYKDFDFTKVSFACKREGAMVKPVDNATLYCYLPTRASWGLPFLMNTDMIPKGDRNDIETEVKLIDDDETNFNEQLASIAGSKLFIWIRELLTSRKYHLGSVFSLVPDFNKCKKEHKDYSSFIEKFEEAFNKSLEIETIVPVPHGIALVNKVILDKTGLSSSGIMTDDEFRKFAGMEDYYLPLQMLRKEKHFDSFLKRYAGDEQFFEVEDLSNLINNDEFQKWLKKQVNNNNFIKFLLEKELLDDFSEHPIFINETDGELYCAVDLYYDVDAYIDDLICFSSDHLHRLSIGTKALFDGNKAFADFVSKYFEKFDSSDFVSELYSSTNRESTIQTLSKISNSIRFVHFLAKEEIDDDDVFVPLYNSGQELIDTEAKLFFDRDNKRGYEIKQMSWLPSNAYDFVSNDYMLRDKDIVEEFLDNYGVRPFSEDIVINEIVLEGGSVDSINDNIKTLNDSIEFISFLETNGNMISEDVFNSSFKVFVNNGGVSSFDTVDSNTFFASPLFDSFDSLSWNDNWLFELDDTYFNGLNEAQKTIRKSFFAKAFGVRDITKEIFYDDFISEELESLNKLFQTDRAKNIDFWRWAHSNIPAKAEELRSLHLIVANSEGEESFAASDSTYIYMSDVYMPEGSCIEDFVKEYIPDSLFVSADYVDDKSSSSIIKWNSFMKNLDVSADVTRILIDNILPDLNKIENDNLPSLLMANWSQLQENGKNFGDLKKLKLRCKDESFYSLKDCCLVNTDKEPFSCVSLDNEYNLKTKGQVGWFISQIAENNDIEIISTASDWRIEKIDKYLQLQDDGGLDDEIHFSFVNELINLDEEETAKLKDQIEEIQLLTNESEYCNAEDLTLGHIYNPICDFEANGVDSLTYLSEDYHNRQINEKNLREVFKIHRFFDKDDIKLLEDNPVFARYIWYTYIKDSKQYEKIKGYAEKGDFDDVPCVLSQRGEVCSPNCLYSAEISEYIKDRTEGWQSKTVDSYLVSSYPELISSLDLSQSLDFNDSLVALLYVQSKEKRKQLYGWLCDGDCDKEAVSRFLEDPRATWKNNKGDDVLIKELYAISPDNERLLSYFRKHDRILDVSYVNKSDFENVCNILGVTIIDDSDVDPIPINKRKLNVYSIFNKSLFVISCLETEQWRERYEEYKQELQNVEFFSCRSINLGYASDYDSISVSAQRFYSCDKQIYFVGMWSDRKVYADVVSAIHENLDLSIDVEKAKQLFDPDESFVDVISEECRSLFSDEDFLMELRKLLPKVYASLFQHEKTDAKQSNSNDVNQEAASSDGSDDLQVDSGQEEEREDDYEAVEPASPKVDNEEWERAVRDYMGGGFQLPEEEILAENMITRWRVLNYLKEHDAIYKISASFDEEKQKEYIQGESIVIPLADGKKLLAQGAKGGIWHISPNVWRGFENEVLVVCLCVGNGDNDFKFAESLEDIEQCADTPNVLVKVSPKDDYSMMESIQTVFPGRDNYKMNIHLMVKVHSTRNNKLDNIFDKAFDAPQDDYEF